MNCGICNLTFSNLVKHHIQSRSKGGGDELSNIANVCPNCHDIIHRGELIIEGKFASTIGIILVWRKKGEKSITGVKDPEVFSHLNNSNKGEI